MSCHSGPSDVLGRRLREGDRVRVVGVPDLAGMTQDARASFLAALKVLKRRPRRVRGFDSRGNAELIVRVGGNLNILALEPGLLEWTR
ncbi:MAG: hypothetical protein FD126_2632 [Elusimicrobia bacterium]|nr:MAG: hypothetical protein FD126_2632 [Elusimicrobiota bacterium]